VVNEWLIGVDEAGRGPLAGPVSVGVVAVPPGFDIAAELPGVKDSKLLNHQKREIVYEAALVRAQRGDLKFSVTYGSHLYIDKFGISRAVRRAVWAGVRKLAEPGEATVLLDGLLKAPPEYHQWTITKGDARVPVIALASIVAKIERDRLMEDMALLYPEYGFDAHKGYATREHRLALKHHGLSKIHRRTFCKVDNSFDSLAIGA
jgi:ribonuclease HII